MRFELMAPFSGSTEVQARRHNPLAHLSKYLPSGFNRLVRDRTSGLITGIFNPTATIFRPFVGTRMKVITA